MEKIYIVTSGEYSDYSINACFSTKEKAEEYIKHVVKIGESFFDDFNIEEYQIDIDTELVNVVTIKLNLNIDFDNLKEENLEVYTETKLKGKVNEETVFKDGICLGIPYTFLKICRIANPNKTIKEETERLKKVAYDTLKRMNYLLKVENVKLEDLNDYLERR